MAGLTESYCRSNETSHASQFKWLDNTFKDAKCIIFFHIFFYNSTAGTLSSVLTFCVKILFCKHYFSPLKTFLRNGKDPEPDTDPYLWLMDPDPQGPKPCGSQIRIPSTGIWYSFAVLHLPCKKPNNTNLPVTDRRYCNFPTQAITVSVNFILYVWLNYLGFQTSLLRLGSSHDRPAVLQFLLLQLQPIPGFFQLVPK